MIPRALATALNGLNWCVAGGWAACPSLATDRDVWIFSIDTIELEGCRQRLLDAVKSTKGFTEQTETEVINYEGVNFTIRKVGYFNYSKELQPLHLMISDAPSPEAVMAGFDISTHAVAIMPEGQIIKHPDWTAVNVPPVKLLNSNSTEARMTKIAVRYGHPVPVSGVTIG